VALQNVMNIVSSLVEAKNLPRLLTNRLAGSILLTRFAFKGCGILEVDVGSPWNKRL
jgi:hypothetical protein